MSSAQHGSLGAQGWQACRLLKQLHHQPTSGPLSRKETTLYIQHAHTWYVASCLQRPPPEQQQVHIPRLCCQRSLRPRRRVRGLATLEQHLRQPPALVLIQLSWQQHLLLLLHWLLLKLHLLLLHGCKLHLHLLRLQLELVLVSCSGRVVAVVVGSGWRQQQGRGGVLLQQQWHRCHGRHRCWERQHMLLLLVLLRVLLELLLHRLLLLLHNQVLLQRHHLCWLLLLLRLLWCKSDKLHALQPLLLVLLLLHMVVAVVLMLMLVVMQWGLRVAVRRGRDCDVATISPLFGTHTAAAAAVGLACCHNCVGRAAAKHACLQRHQHSRLLLQLRLRRLHGLWWWWLRLLLLAMPPWLLLLLLLH